MIRIQLPPGEADQLGHLFRSTEDRKLRDRLQIILMAHRGRPRQGIARDLGIHRISVTRWLNAYCAHGLDWGAVTFADAVTAVRRRPWREWVFACPGHREAFE